MLCYKLPRFRSSSTSLCFSLLATVTTSPLSNENIQSICIESIVPKQACHAAPFTYAKFTLKSTYRGMHRFTSRCISDHILRQRSVSFFFSLVLLHKLFFVFATKRLALLAIFCSFLVCFFFFVFRYTALLWQNEPRARRNALKNLATKFNCHN